MGEYIEDLGGLRLIQQDGQFKIGLDSVLLARFAVLKKGYKVCELGCGAGALILLMLSKQPDIFIDGIEIQPECAYLARRNVMANGLEHQVRITEGDFREDIGDISPSSYDLVVSNPPYLQAGSGKPAKNEAILRSRFEIDCTMRDVCARACRLLRPGGAFCAVYPPNRLAELIRTLKDNGLEPKRMQAAHHSPYKAASLVLIEARKGGRVGLVIEPPVITGE